MNGLYSYLPHPPPEGLCTHTHTHPSTSSAARETLKMLKCEDGRSDCVGTDTGLNQRINMSSIPGLHNLMAVTYLTLISLCWLNAHWVIPVFMNEFWFLPTHCENRTVNDCRRGRGLRGGMNNWRPGEEFVLDYRRTSVSDGRSRRCLVCMQGNEPVCFSRTRTSVMSTKSRLMSQAYASAWRHNKETLFSVSSRSSRTAALLKNG